MKKYFLFLGLFLFFACGSGGGDGSSDDAPAPSSSVHISSVQYQVDSSGCLISANDFDNKNEFTDGNYKSMDFIWQCTKYKEHENIYVSLSFDNNNDGTQCLKLHNEYMSNGIC